jgi:uncharacterized protein (TIGR02246 family)
MTTDERALSQIVAKLEEAWNAGDSAAFASDFTDDASFIHIYGGRLDGRPAIEAVHRQIFDTIYKGSHNHYMLQGIRFIRPDVAIVFVQARLKFYEAREAREIQARPTMIAVRENGRWQLAAFQNTRISEMPAAVKTPGGHAS